MKIVVLDGYTLNPGDLSWAGVMELGDVTVHDRTPGELVLERAEGAEILLTNKTPLGEAEFVRLPALRFICVLATGYNIVDTDAAARRGIVVSNVPSYGTQSVAQMTFALLLELCHHVQRHSDAVRGGEWECCPDYSFRKTPLIELEGKTMGIVGMGRIGAKVADIAAAFGMDVVGYDSSPTDQSARPRFRWATLGELLEESDVVSLHCPLFPSTRGIINRDALARMKPTAFLINTSRGPLVAEDDLADALNRGTIAGAAVDVLSAEPPKAGNPLLTAQNCIVTPHIAWATVEARRRLMDIAVENTRAFLGGKPINRVDV